MSVLGASGSAPSPNRLAIHSHCAFEKEGDVDPDGAVLRAPIGSRHRDPIPSPGRPVSPRDGASFVADVENLSVHARESGNTAEARPNAHKILGRRRSEGEHRLDDRHAYERAEEEPRQRPCENLGRSNLGWSDFAMARAGFAIEPRRGCMFTICSCSRAGRLLGLIKDRPQLLGHPFLNR